MMWRPRADHGRKQETGDEDNGSSLPSAAVRYGAIISAPSSGGRNWRSSYAGLDTKWAITEAYLIQRGVNFGLANVA